VAISTPVNRRVRGIARYELDLDAQNGLTSQLVIGRPIGVTAGSAADARGAPEC
jgi:hypothetical protein